MSFFDAMPMTPRDVISVGKDFVIRVPDPNDDDTLLRIESPKGWRVELRYDGTLEYSDGYDPDEAARLFWEALARWGARLVAPIDPN